MIYPKHVGLIPDGNRTRAKEKGLPQIVGHMEGTKTVSNLVTYIFSKTPIQVFTVWGLSTENLKERTPEELEYLFDIYKSFNSSMFEFLAANRINMRWIGNPVGLPNHLLDFLDNKQKELDFDTDKYIVLAINYGGRDEVIRGVNKFILQNPGKQIDEESLASCLEIGDLPPVELVIRTKGDQAQRLSGFLLRWIGYAQLYFTPIKCPDLNETEFEKALMWFDSIANKRNFGK